MKFVSIILLAVVSLTTFGQTAKVIGRVIDSKTLAPIEFANVFINNTTLGVVTNANGEFALKNITLGETEIVISFVGYSPLQIRMVVKELNKPLSVFLIPDSKQLEEVEIKAGRDQAWEKQLKRFELVFFGQRHECKILNPWVLDFSNQNGLNLAKASVPLEIENRKLGYKLSFQLKNFGYSETEFYIVGNTRFIELNAPTPELAAKWTENRERAYRGSVKHLMKSIIDGKLTKEGFDIYRYKVNGRPRSPNFSIELKTNLVPYDTSVLVTSTGINEYQIALKENTEVHFKNDFTSVNYYTDISYPVSWLQLKSKNLRVNSEGALINPTDLVISGNMSEARVSSMIPLDYKPGNKIIALTSENIKAQRLQEKVYVSTDKPYYYTGETVWFNAVMCYRAPALADTLSKVLYVDLINSDRRIVQSRILPIDSGRASNFFTLPAEGNGNYLLRAYTQWMRNYGIDHFFYKPVKVLNFNEVVEDTIIPPKPEPSLKISFDKLEYNRGEEVKIMLAVDSLASEEGENNCVSISVYNEDMIVPLAPAESKTEEIKFQTPSRFKSQEFYFPIEHSIDFAGVYKDKKKKGKSVDLTFIPENFSKLYQTTTLESGEFFLTDIAFYDSMKWFVKPSSGRVELKIRKSPSLPEVFPKLNLKITTSSKTNFEMKLDSVKPKMLKTIEVKGKKIEKHDNPFAEPDVYLKSDAIEAFPNLAVAITAKIPGYKLVFYQTNWFLISVRGDINRFTGGPAEPALMVDNILVVGEYTGDRLVAINPAAIDHIEVKGMIGSNLGANGENGLISVFSKRADETNTKTLPFIKVRGFDRDKIFFQDRESHNEQSLLYWKPRTVLDSKKTIQLSFLSSDQSGSFRVVAEGASNYGKIIHAEAVFQVK